jgi:DNA-binding MarR family transcriptional regulator
MTNTPEMSDEPVQLFALLHDTIARLNRSYGALLEEQCDLPLAWFYVLLQLRSSENASLKMNELADAIVLSSGGTTRLIDRLVEAGLVSRRECPEDRRAIFIEITPAGDRKLEQALAAHSASLESQLCQRLSCDDRRTLGSLLAKLNAEN